MYVLHFNIGLKYYAGHNVIISLRWWTRECLGAEPPLALY